MKVTSASSPWIDHVEGSWPPCSEDTQAALGRHPCDKEPRLLPTASTTSHVSEPPWKWVLQPRQADETANTANVWEVVTQSPSQTSNSRKLQNVTVNCCSKSQIFGLFCCSAICNFYTHTCKQYVPGRRNIKFKDTRHTQETASRGKNDKRRDQRWGLFRSWGKFWVPCGWDGWCSEASLPELRTLKGREGRTETGRPLQ